MAKKGSTSAAATADQQTRTTSTPSSSSPSSSSSSSIHLVLISIILVGVGAIGGYGIFYSVYNHRCSDLMDDAEGRFNQTKEDLQQRLVEALHMEGSASEKQESELLELRGRLDHEADWMDKHKSLSERHESTIEQLTEAQTKEGQYSLERANLLTQLQMARSNAKEFERSWNNAEEQKYGLEKELQQANKQVEVLQDNAYCETRQTKTKTHMQQLHTFLTKQAHGEGPYYVQFQIEVEGANANEDAELASSLVVEVSTLGALPHSVYSFMTLVDNGIYNEAEFLATQSILHLDSDEDKLQTLGYAAVSALGVVESAAQGPCAPYSVGFVGSTGGLKIIMTNMASKHGSLACFGRITRGRQAVSLIQRAAKEGKAVSIHRVEKLASFDGKSTMNEGEL